MHGFVAPAVVNAATSTRRAPPPSAESTESGQARSPRSSSSPVASWPHVPQLPPGNRWRARVTAVPPHGAAVFAGFSTSAFQQSWCVPPEHPFCWIDPRGRRPIREHWTAATCHPSPCNNGGRPVFVRSALVGGRSMRVVGGSDCHEGSRWGAAHPVKGGLEVDKLEACRMCFNHASPSPLMGRRARTRVRRRLGFPVPAW